MDLLLVGLHVPAGLLALVAGLIAMLSRKGGWWHRRAGLFYLIGIIILTLTARGFVASRGSEFIFLFAMGMLATTLAMSGYLLRRKRQDIHIAAMGLSFIVMLTAFYVDNGPKLPVWEHLPPIAFWIFPAAIGLPILILALYRRGYTRIGLWS